MRPNISHDFPRLFSDHFNLAASQNPSRTASLRQVYGSQGSSRPPSSSAGAEEGEAVWLAKAFPGHGADTDESQAWDRVAGGFLGKLAFDFDAVMGVNKHA